jgi:hypothetical protein
MCLFVAKERRCPMRGNREKERKTPDCLRSS